MPCLGYTEVDHHDDCATGGFDAMGQPTSKMFKRYAAHLIFRAGIFGGVSYVYLTSPQKIASIVASGFFEDLGLPQLLWLVLMTDMIRHLLPKSKITMGVRKVHAETFHEAKTYRVEDLYRYVRESNIRAWKVMLVWLCFNAVFASIYLAGIIGDAEMIMLTMFYYLSDFICMLIFCPFQTFWMKNRCCVNCRIYDWGHFMMFTPMLFIKSFFSWSLFFTACVVLIRWEVAYASHPERFWDGSNTAIRCVNCSDAVCRIKFPRSKKGFADISKE